ncbi:regulator of chromosome condensation 1/beta-lactamase-inhibitor protein II [Pelagophyceae sp. CCMP2097]|nr:regulator of chromosome condensation 1/beta-lactamase-inhibitor protein II [Pelagophyceae sp. CCMP2097]
MSVVAFGWNASGQVDAADAADSVVFCERRGTDVACVGAGMVHSAYAYDEVVFVSGGDESGQCGGCGIGALHGATARLGLRRVRRLACGAGHSAALDVGGAAFCWGGNAYGQCGRAARAACPEPHRVAAAGVVDVAAGARFTALATGAAGLVTFGANDYGQLGRDTDGAFDCEPRRVELERCAPFGDAEITALFARVRWCVDRVAAGDDHAVVAANGCAFTCGSDARGQRGRGDGAERGDALRIDVRALRRPSVVVSLLRRGLCVVDVAAGAAASAAVCGSGELYTWGSNDAGALGLGALEDVVAMPQRVDFGEGLRCTDVDIGDAHAAAVVDGRLFVWGAAAAHRLGKVPVRNAAALQLQRIVRGFLGARGSPLRLKRRRRRPRVPGARPRR